MLLSPWSPAPSTQEGTTPVLINAAWRPKFAAESTGAACLLAQGSPLHISSSPTLACPPALSLQMVMATPVTRAQPPVAASLTPAQGPPSQAAPSQAPTTPPATWCPALRSIRTRASSCTTHAPRAAGQAVQGAPGGQAPVGPLAPLLHPGTRPWATTIRSTSTKGMQGASRTIPQVGRYRWLCHLGQGSLEGGGGGRQGSTALLALQRPAVPSRTPCASPPSPLNPILPPSDS